MTSLPRGAAFRYGFSLFSYWLVLVALCGALVAGGGWLVSEQVQNGGIGTNEAGALAAVGGFAAALGVFLYGAGQVGLAYKLVADGTSVGVARATTDSLTSDAETDEEPSSTDATDEAESETAPAVDDGGEQAQSVGTDESAIDRPEPRPRAPRESVARTRPPTDASPTDSGATKDSPLDAGEVMTETEPTNTDSTADVNADRRRMPSPESDGVSGPSVDEQQDETGDGWESPVGGADTAETDHDAVDGAAEPDDRAATTDDSTEPAVESPENPDPDEGEMSGSAGADASDPAEADPSDSPEDLVSESEIAGELGFGQSDGPPSRDELAGDGDEPKDGEPAGTDEDPMDYPAAESEPAESADSGAESTGTDDTGPAAEPDDAGEPDDTDESDDAPGLGLFADETTGEGGQGGDTAGAGTERADAETGAASGDTDDPLAPDAGGSSDSASEETADSFTYGASDDTVERSDDSGAADGTDGGEFGSGDQSERGSGDPLSPGSDDTVQDSPDGDEPADEGSDDDDDDE
ncbi:hypothetical protein BRD06_03865 [Halobacteriales archaeon QS_9_67_15]|nr:MAG: hypothetical protein BRD06_03865 [Halobacteriales archaeon QS_9_67_15]